MRKPKKTVTERQSQAPEQLAELIRLVNAEGQYQQPPLPREADILRAAKLVFGESHVSAEELRRQIQKEWIKVCRELASPLSEEIRAFLGPPELPLRFCQNWEVWRSATRVLLAIASRDKNAVFVQQRFFEEMSNVRVGLTVNEQGMLAVSQNLILDAITGVPADRIRTCAVCGQIFWAKRINSKCCQETHRKTYNQRNSRYNRLEAQARAKRRELRKGR